MLHYYGKVTKEYVLNNPFSKTHKCITVQKRHRGIFTKILMSVDLRLVHFPCKYYLKKKVLENINTTSLWVE